MYRLIYTIANTLLTFLEWAMLLRALVSWFPQMRQSSFGVLLYQITEPLIAPVRNLLDRIPALRSFPLDISFMLVYMLLIVIHGVL